MTPREQRLRERIDRLTDERDDALTELAAVKEDIRVAKSIAAKSPDDGTHAWLAEYDRRKAARAARRREQVAEREAKRFLERRGAVA